MFVRKKTNRSGTISIVVVSKAHGKFTEVKKFGVAKSEEEADEMFREAQLWLRTHEGQQNSTSKTARERKSRIQNVSSATSTAC